MFRAILNIVVISRTDGNTEKSSASLLNIDINNINNDNDIFILNIMSTKNGGIGMIIIKIINIIPTDTKISPTFINNLSPIIFFYRIDIC